MTNLSKQFIKYFFIKYFWIHSKEKKNIINNKFTELSKLLSLELLNHYNFKSSQKWIDKLTRLKHILLIGAIFNLNKFYIR